MVIDVISYSDEQFAALKEEQILEIKNVQLQVNELRAKIEKLKEDAKFKLVKGGVARSAAFEKRAETEVALLEQEIDHLREGLLFYLRFSARADVDSTPENVAPYVVDYSLPITERYIIVRDYYYATYSDPQERLDAFNDDEVALVYLGELHSTLYDVLLYDVNYP